MFEEHDVLRTKKVGFEKLLKSGKAAVGRILFEDSERQKHHTKILH